MGKVGFLFSLTKERDLVDNNNKRFIALFVESTKLSSTSLIGFEENLPKENTEFLFLSKELHLDKFEFTSLRYAKVSTHDKTILDFENNTMWASAYTYKYLRELMEIKDHDQLLHELLLVHVSRLVEFLNL